MTDYKVKLKKMNQAIRFTKLNGMNFKYLQYFCKDPCSKLMLMYILVKLNYDLRTIIDIQKYYKHNYQHLNIKESYWGNK